MKIKVVNVNMKNGTLKMIFLAISNIIGKKTVNMDKILFIDFWIYSEFVYRFLYILICRNKKIVIHYLIRLTLFNFILNAL